MNEQIKSYLARIEKIDTMIESRMLEIEKAETECQKTTTSYGFERVQSSPSSSRAEMALDHYISVKQQNMKEIAELRSERESIKRIIEEKLPPDMYSVIHKKYFLRKEMWEIAEEMDRSKSWVAWMHGKALDYLQQLLF